MIAPTPPDLNNIDSPSALLDLPPTAVPNVLDFPAPVNLPNNPGLSDDFEWDFSISLANQLNEPNQLITVSSPPAPVYGT